MKAIETPVLKMYGGSYRLRREAPTLCMWTLLGLFEIGTVDKCEKISFRLADRLTRESVCIQLRYCAATRHLGWRTPGDEDWHGFFHSADRWLKKHVPVIARRAKSKIWKPLTITLHVTLYIHEGEQVNP